MEPVTCINTGLNPSVYKFKGWNLMYYDRKFSTLMFFGSGFLPMIWWNDLIIWSCWIKQGSHDVITGMCQWNQCISWCQRLFTLLEWILLKGLQQVLHCFSSVSVWFLFGFYLKLHFFSVLGFCFWVQRLWRSCMIKCLSL